MPAPQAPSHSGAAAEPHGITCACADTASETMLAINKRRLLISCPPLQVPLSPVPPARSVAVIHTCRVSRASGAYRFPPDLRRINCSEVNAKGEPGGAFGNCLRQWDRVSHAQSPGRAGGCGRGTESEIRQKRTRSPCALLGPTQQSCQCVPVCQFAGSPVRQCVSALAHWFTGALAASGAEGS